MDGDLRSELVLYGSRLVGTTSVSFLEVEAFDTSAGWTNRQTLASGNQLGTIQQLLSVNGDAFPDLVTLEPTSVAGVFTLGYYPGGAGGFGARQVLANNVPFQQLTRIADLNNDGRPDLLSYNTLYLATPSGGFYPAQPIWIGIAGVQHVADFNRDGKPDLMNGLSILLQE